MKIIRKILVIIPILIFLFAVIIIINIAISLNKGSVPKIFGYSFMIVETGSMEPTLHINDFVIVKAQKKYYETEILSFYYDLDNDHDLEIVTHRLIRIEDDKYILQGDVGDEQQEITKKDIIGKVVHKSRLLGLFFSLPILQNKNLIFGILVLLLTIFAIYQILNIIKISKTKENKNGSH